MDQEEEISFWGDCSNTYGEETKQFQYAHHMGIQQFGDGRSPFALFGLDKSWVDFGGGPSSMLLKMQRATYRMVIDPLPVPEWVPIRYRNCGVKYLRARCDADDTSFKAAGKLGQFDIGLCYNVLQHVEHPERFVANLRRLSKVQVVFEWINLPPHPGHPNELTKENLEAWFGKEGFTGRLTGENQCWGEFWCLPLQS